MKINVQNREKTNAALTAFQKRCTARTLDADFIEAAILQSEARLRIILPKSHWKGLTLSITASPHKIPSSYNGIPMATFAVVTQYSSGWFLTKLSRDTAREGGRDVMIRGFEAKADELAAFLSRTVGTFELEDYCH